MSSSTDFLSCDGQFLKVPDNKKFRADKKKDFPSTRISCLTSQLATDSPPRPPKPKETTFCCIRTKTVSIIGSCLTMIGVLAISGFFIYLYVAEFKKEGVVFSKLLGFVLPPLIVLFCFSSFQWGILVQRHIPLFPFILATLLIVVALIAGVLTLPGEVNDLSHNDTMQPPKLSKIFEVVSIRVGICVVVILQVVFLYAYLRTFWFFRKLSL